MRRREEELDPGSVHDHLVRAAGHLRSEVAGAITRKRAPVLVYRLAANPDAFCLLTAIRRAGREVCFPGSRWLRFNRPSRVRADLRYWALRS